MNQNGIELQVCVDGKPTREYAHEGQLFVEGRKGSSFTLKIRNHRAERANVIVLVDGVNVVTGDETLEKGYIVSGLSSYEIQGWRTSLQDVSTFVFKDKNGAYSKTVTGSTKMCGLISVLAYEEKKVVRQVEKVIEKHWYPDPIYVPVPYPVYPRPRPIYPYYDYVWCGSSSDMGCAGSAGPSGSSGMTFNASLDGPMMRCANSADGEAFSTFSANITTSGNVTASASAGVTINSLSLGTGWGPQKLDSVAEVEFKNGVRVAAMELYYSDAKGLKKMGIDMKKTPAISKTALPTALAGFCRPPA